jgi:hypothetical protein
VAGPTSAPLPANPRRLSLLFASRLGTVSKSPPSSGQDVRTGAESATAREREEGGRGRVRKGERVEEGRQAVRRVGERSQIRKRK